MKKAKRVSPVPKGFHTVTQTLVVRNATQAIEFYKKVFGAKELFRNYGLDGKTIMHADIRIGDSIIMLSNEVPSMKCLSPQPIGGNGTFMHLYVRNADAVFNGAITAGATAMVPIMDAFWGDRFGQMIDPFGHTWAIATRKHNLSRKKMEKAGQAAFKTMAECNVNN